MIETTKNRIHSYINEKRYCVDIGKVIVSFFHSFCRSKVSTLEVFENVLMLRVARLTLSYGLTTRRRHACMNRYRYLRT